MKTYRVLFENANGERYTSFVKGYSFCEIAFTVGNVKTISGEKFFLRGIVIELEEK